MSAPEKRKASAGGREAFQDTTNRAKNTSLPRFKQRLKRIIVCLALWGLLPIALVDFLIRQLGLKHD